MKDPQSGNLSLGFILANDQTALHTRGVGFGAEKESSEYPKDLWKVRRTEATVLSERVGFTQRNACLTNVIAVNS